MVPAHDMRFGEQSAVRVHRQLTADLDPAVLRKPGRFSRLAETEAFQRNPWQDREGVITE